MALLANKTADGMLGVRWSKIKLGCGSSAVVKTVQASHVMLSHGDPVALQKLGQAINASLAKAANRPLQSLSSNIHQGGVAGLKRKASQMSGASCGSAISCGSVASGASADSKASDGPNAEELPELSQEQQHILSQVKEGHSVFFTGCAGIGKGEGDLGQLAKLASRPDAAQRWRKARALVIDEISMVDGALFDALEALARGIRSKQEPFGGIQLILAGDFHQLPPVAKGKEAAAARKFAFEAATWRLCVHHCAQLTRADQEFVDMLASIRSGRCNPKGSLVEQLQGRCGQALDTSDGILPTKLYTHREDVDLVNSHQLQALPAQPVRYVAQDSGPSTDLLKTACPARGTVELKEGAQVMLIRTLSTSRGLVNGSRGVVEKFVGGAFKLPVVRFANVSISLRFWTPLLAFVILAVGNIPLDLGWAMSVHKSQGMTLDRVEVNLERAFEAGMAYVALSRVKSLGGLRLLGGISRQALTADAKVLAFYKSMQQHLY
ncbi:MAG: ATP-dependent DNA helicase PIF1 [Trebouxia sp. A1-2]|nr:MAG: ATP-dependent DNA helicase PIF1 [Trebouxia sp. A1-2]